jgi:chromosome partitioning protein
METTTIREDYTITPTDLLNCVSDIGTLHGIHKMLKDKDIPFFKSGSKKLIPSDSARTFFELRGFKYPKRNLTFHIIKGGVGKSSLASAVAIRANMYGCKVLCVDFDQQGNLTRSLGVDGRNRPVWLHLFRKEISAIEALVPITKSLHLIPSSMNNSKLDFELSSSPVDLRSLVRNTLAEIRDYYDLVIFDCPPSLNRTTAAVACASDLIVMPINADGYSMDALDGTIEEIRNLNKTFNLNIPYAILWNKYDQREKLSVKYLHELASKESSKDKILPVVIRTDATIKNALDQGLSIFELKSKSGICEDLDRLTRELLGISKWSEKHQEKVQ